LPRSTLFPYTTLFRSVGNVQLFPIPVRAFSSISPPTRTQSRCADHCGYNVAILLDGHQRPKGGNPAQKLFGPVDGINNHSRPVRSEEHTSELQSRGHL